MCVTLELGNFAILVAVSFLLNFFNFSLLFSRLNTAAVSKKLTWKTLKFTSWKCFISLFSCWVDAAALSASCLLSSPLSVYRIIALNFSFALVKKITIWNTLIHCWISLFMLTSCFVCFISFVGRPINK